MDNTINIMIVDNCSNKINKDQLIQFSRFNQRIHCCFNDKNSGYAAGNNFGIIEAYKRFAYFDKICIMNPDVVIPSANVLYDMVSILNKRNDIGALTVKTIFNGKTENPNVCAWRFFSKITILLQGTIIGKLLFNNQYYLNLDNNADLDSLSIVDVVQGCFFMINRNVFEGIEFFDDRTFLYYEEMILAKKLLNNGYRNAVLVKHYIYHNHTSKDRDLKNIIKKTFDMKCYLDSRLYYLDKYMVGNRLYKLFAKTFLVIDYRLKKIILRFLLNEVNMLITAFKLRYK